MRRPFGPLSAIRYREVTPVTQSTTDASNPARRQFGAVAAAYATSAVHASGADLTALVAAAGLTGTERVLDMGCGAGHTALAVASNAAQVTAIDVTPEMLAVAEGLARARELTNVDFRLADVAALPFPSSSFEVVTSRYSAHHYPDPARALAEAARVLLSGGRLLLVDTVAPEIPALDTFFNTAELLRDGSHARNWRLSEWQQLMRAAGFVPHVLMQMTLDLDGDSWVQRSQTPPPLVTALKALFEHATPAAREAFRLRTGPNWGWTIPVALLEGLRTED